MIEILLSTYNGAQYLGEQLDSIISQTNHDWHLTIRDDGSTDSTPQIIGQYITQYPTLISLNPTSGKNLGVISSFEQLLAHAHADYFMLCDQDDVWLPEKIESTYLAMQRLEQQHGVTTPILIHTDLAVADEAKNVVGDSFWRFANIRPDILNNNIKYLAVCNSATGCTIMLNSACRLAALPFPATILMHDAWLAFVACRQGVIEGLDHPTILYRQHNNNTLGANRYSHNPLKKIMNLSRVLDEVPKIYAACPGVFKNKLDVFITKVKYSSILFFST